MPQNSRWFATAKQKDIVNAGIEPSRRSKPQVSSNAEDNTKCILVFFPAEMSHRACRLLLVQYAQVLALPFKQHLGRRGSASRPGLAAVHPFLASLCPAPAQTGSLPLNPSPWICQAPGSYWHIKIMKLKTTATQSYISFHVLNI